MIQLTFKVQAFWDSEAEVWVATSEDLPGLVTEAFTMESLTNKLREMIPEIMILNRVVPPDYVGSIRFGLDQPSTGRANASKVLSMANKVNI
ncbi:DUF1902 domain-containing protein [Nostocales cyanobacterium LEGE 11386]|nr:DUF1902 domain-containing protein [Nostocales cyanobacterium LEGE 11386]